MQKLVTAMLLGAVLSLTACAGTDHKATYGYEQQAPYADERTVGSQEPAAMPAERTFESRQRK